jgi:3',5'-cyclic AMP phosphodiesterase CpdA
MKPLRLLHLSDLHFGRHQFDPPATPSGHNASNAGYPTLFESLLPFLHDVDGVVITGDITQTADPSEFNAAATLLSSLSAKVGPDRLFLVPGNHDLAYAKSDVDARWGAYSSFYNNFFRHPKHAAANRAFIPSTSPEAFSQVIDRSKDLELVVLELNSSALVAKDSPDEHRGQVTVAALGALDAALQKIPNLNNCVRLAVIHHHPVLLPVFAEPHRQYDATLNSGYLLRLLRTYGFHAILHGHKHHPHIFSDDSLCSWDDSDHAPLLVIAGGSAAVVQDELPKFPNSANTFNHITIKTVEGDTRIIVNTHGLECFDKHGAPLLPQAWHWRPRRTVDRVLRRRALAPAAAAGKVRQFDDGPPGCGESERKAVYAKQRGNMPVASIVPSIEEGQEHEVHVRIVGHKHRAPEDIPLYIEWAAGPRFPIVRCEHTTNPEFSARFHCYGAVLIQARMKFKSPDETGADVADAYVYAESVHVVSS